ncbi:MAG TPA: choice-of-anchor D domain-containing protein [Candidatus Dormibacteraeota bacterium]|nr:choice-of-anchor D domain-containing protein [Candidatus Dormibacteraeota bacterium]
MIRSGVLVAVFIWTALPAPAAADINVRPTLSSPPIKAGLTPNGSWTTYHFDHAHTGFDPAAPAMSAVQTTPGWNLSALDQQVYGEVLVSGGLVYAATLNNTVYALDQNTGSIVWQDHLGAPQTFGWICGNISASGILGTMAIDAPANRIYAVGEIAGSTPIFHLWGLDLSSGNVVMDVPLAPAGFDWKIQQQRGAIAIANGYVYVPFGGRAGDCFDNGQPYFGWVVGVPVGGGSNLVYRTPSGGESVWDAGGIVVDDTSHNVFFATGNAIPCSGATYSDAVVRVSPTLGSPSFFEPNDWQANWCGPDSDLGSASPTLLSPNLMFQSGKHGGGFLLNPTNLGGVDGQLFPAQNPYVQADVCLGNTSDATFGSFAYAAPFVYVECEGHGLVALNVNTATPSFTPCGSGCGAPDWNAGGTTTFGPPIVAGGAVWVASNGGGLYAFNAANGTQIFHSAGFGINRFVTPTEAGSQVFVPSGTVIRSFSYGITLFPKSLDFGGVLPGSTSAAQTVTLHNIQSSSLTVATTVLSDTTNYLKGTDTCSGMVVAAGGSCSVQITFKPTAFGTHPATVTITDNGLGSPRTVPLSGLSAIDNQGHLYTLDGYGRIHPAGTTPTLASATAWGWNIARSLALFPDGTGGYILDGYGGIHPFGSANPVSGFSYWGWDIARQIVLAPWSTVASPAGWTLDGYGGIHPFGGAPAITGASYWGWDIARGIVVLADSTPGSVAGYTLDGYGGVHPFGGAPAVAFTGYWGGWDIAHSITLMASATKSNPGGWVLDGYGGIHQFGAAPTISNGPYWGWDIARGIVAWTGSGTGGWVLDGYGGIAPFGSAPAISPYSRWGIDIAVALGSSGTSTAGLRRAG